MDFTQPWDFGDVTFIVEDRKIYVNRAALSMTSEVFRAMFTSDFKEKEMTEIPISYKKFDDFLELMQIIHPCPKICVNDINVENLLNLAHEYQIHHVVDCCEEVLVKQPPGIHNLILADKFSLTKLRQFFFDHLKQVAFEGHPEFELVDKDTRIEVFERNSILQGPSVQNLLLAEKYKDSDFYEKCVQYIKDTPLSKLRTEPGFANLKTDTLLMVLNYKVDQLEPLHTEVSDLTNNWTTLGNPDKCSYCGYKDCNNRTCYGCTRYRFEKICEVMKKE